MTPAPSAAAAVIPVLDDLVYWVRYQVRTMDDQTFAMAIAGLVVVMALVMAGLRPKR